MKDIVTIPTDKLIALICPRCHSTLQPFEFRGGGRYTLVCKCRDSHTHCWHGAQFGWTDHIIEGCCICCGYPCSQTNEYFQNPENVKDYFRMRF